MRVRDGVKLSCSCDNCLQLPPPRMSAENAMLCQARTYVDTGIKVGPTCTKLKHQDAVMGASITSCNTLFHDYRPSHKINKRESNFQIVGEFGAAEVLKI
jgi:hypothetical protein